MACGSNYGYIMRISNQPHHFRAVFTIENFLNYPAKVGTFIQSPPFRSILDDNLGLKWYLKIYPRGQTVAFRDSISVFLLCDELPKNIVAVKMYLAIQILAENGDKVFTNEAEKCSTLDVKKYRLCGWDEFIGRKELENKREVLLPSRNLTLECVVRAYIEFKNLPSTTEIQKGSGDISPLNLEAKILQKIYREKICPDVRLKASDGRVLEAHKCVLSVRSPYFMAMFRHPMKENAEGLVDWSQDVNGRELEALLHYFYLGTPPANLESMALKLFQISDMQGILGLKEICEEALIRQINDNNAMDLINFANIHAAHKLKKAAARRIAYGSK